MSLRKAPPNKRTKDTFIEKAKEKHGEKFDYSDVEYTTCKDLVTIKCTTNGHGAFRTTPDSHLSGQGGCPQCRYITIASKRKKSQDTFLKEAIAMHGDTYDYSHVVYTNHTSKISIICKDHGVFEQKAGNHLRGDGCIKCAGIYKPTTEEWISSAKQLHGEEKFDYTNVMYINAYTEIDIRCKVCNKLFKQTPTAHMHSQIGCDWCRKKHTYTTEEFIEEARKIHGDTYDYSKAEYRSACSPIIIICKIHGEFLQTPSDHKNQGSGCKKCSNVYSPTTEEWVQWAREIWGNTYDYSAVRYSKTIDKITIICKTHGPFDTMPANHIHATNPTGCPLCVRKGEGIMAEFLTSQNIAFIKEWTNDSLAKRRMDFMIPALHVCIEVDGLQHFKQVRDWKSPIDQCKIDVEKMKICIDNGISVIRVFQPSITRTNEKWKSYLQEALRIISLSAVSIGIFPTNITYAEHIEGCKHENIITKSV